MCPVIYTKSFYWHKYARQMLWGNLEEALCVRCIRCRNETKIIARKPTAIWNAHFLLSSQMTHGTFTERIRATNDNRIRICDNLFIDSEQTFVHPTLPTDWDKVSDLFAAKFPINDLCGHGVVDLMSIRRIKFPFPQRGLAEIIIYERESRILRRATASAKTENSSARNRFYRNIRIRESVIKRVEEHADASEHTMYWRLCHHFCIIKLFLNLRWLRVAAVHSWFEFSNKTVPLGRAPLHTRTSQSSYRHS